MKRLFTILFSLMLTASLLAQNDVTTFLGIPVDGTREEFIEKLQEKGFKQNAVAGFITGTLNNQPVIVSIEESKGKVYRVVVFEEVVQDEEDIRIAFNQLTHQFQNDFDYVRDKNNRILSEGENIGFGIRKHHEQYQNIFYQTNDPTNIDKNKIVRFVIRSITDNQYSIVIFFENRYNYNPLKN